MVVAWHIFWFAVLFALVCGPATVVSIWVGIDNKRRKRKYEEERAVMEAEFCAHINNLREVRAALEQQKKDQPAVVVPVTYCERQERRRIIKLES